MEGPPLGPGEEDITWPDQVAPRGRKASSTRKIKPQTSNLKKILSKIIAECPCTKAKANTAADRGEVRNLSIPNQMESILSVDFLELPRLTGHDFALVATNGLSRYSRVFPLTKKVDGEGVLKEIFKGWVEIYGLPKIIHND